MESRRPRLLVADDSVTIQKVVRLTFTDEGMDVVAVGTGEEAVRELEQSGPFDAVLADVQMPGPAGYELCERIKNDSRTRNTPVILLTGAFEPFDEAEARRVGADEVLSKPFQSIRDLIGKVGSLLGGKKPEEDEARTLSVAPRADERDALSHMTARVGPSEEAARRETAWGTDAAAQEKTEPFEDMSMDDQLIEAKPAESFGAQSVEHTAETVHEDESAFAFPPDAREHEEWVGETRGPEVVAAVPREAVAETHAATHDAAFESRPVSYELGLETQPNASEHVFEAQAPPQRAFAAHAASAAAADDALLDIGTIEPPASTAEADDFILDIDFDEPPPPPRREAKPAFNAGAQTQPDAPSAFAEAAHGSAAPEPASDFTPPVSLDDFTQPASFDEAPAREFIEPQVVPSEEPLKPHEDLTVEGDIARPPVEPQQPEAPATIAEEEHAREASPSSAFVEAQPAAFVGQAAAEQGIDPQQLSPEVIDKIARRAVELMSERVVQEIAWEVVPALAERLIKQRLDEMK